MSCRVGHQWISNLITNACRSSNDNGSQKYSVVPVLFSSGCAVNDEKRKRSSIIPIGDSDNSRHTGLTLLSACVLSCVVSICGCFAIWRGIRSMGPMSPLLGMAFAALGALVTIVFFAVGVLGKRFRLAAICLAAFFGFVVVFLASYLLWDWSVTIAQGGGERGEEYIYCLLV